MATGTDAASATSIDQLPGFVGHGFRQWFGIWSNFWMLAVVESLGYTLLNSGMCI